MNSSTFPALARRLRLSTGGICAAVVLTFAALLAVAAAVDPNGITGDAAVSIEAPVTSYYSVPNIEKSDRQAFTSVSTATYTTDAVGTPISNFSDLVRR